MTALALCLVIPLLMGPHPVGDAIPMPQATHDHKITGIANYARASHGRNYLAMRFPRGTHVRICGKAACVRMIVNDYGPKNRHKVADIAVVKWEKVCGVPRTRGVCKVTIRW